MRIFVVWPGLTSVAVNKLVGESAGSSVGASADFPGASVGASADFPGSSVGASANFPGRLLDSSVR